MSKTRVFQVDCPSTFDDARFLAPFLVTREAAEAAGCKVLPYSAQDVDSSLVDQFGIYPPRLSGKPIGGAEKNRLLAFRAGLGAPRQTFKNA
jgi:hypothetical protein